MSWLKTTLESVAVEGKSMAGAAAVGTLKKIGSLLSPGAAPAVRTDAVAGLIKDFQAAFSGVGTGNNNAPESFYVHPFL
jgi:hypothetical protein